MVGRAGSAAPLAPVQLRSDDRLRTARTVAQRLLVGAVGVATTVVVVVPIAMVIVRSFRVRSHWSLAAWRAVLEGPQPESAPPLRC